MLQKHWNIRGIDILRPAGYLDLTSHDPTVLINMTFYLIEDIEWIREVLIYRTDHSMFLIFRIKMGTETEHVEEVMKAGMIRIKEHIEAIGLHAVYEEKSVMQKNSYIGPIRSNCVRIEYYPIRSIADDIRKEV